jgi:POT family proton-dependent oligopeptide transporter
MATTKMKHPQPLYLLFLVTMWERFSFYGMRALLVLYLVSDKSRGGLQWTSEQAGSLYGSYNALTYIATLFGGYLADKYIGFRRSVLVGGILITLGHISLSIDSIPNFYAGLILIIIGTGAFKPTASSMVGQLYEEGSPLKDSAYTIFYMGINIGAFLGALVCGYLGENVGWHYGFGAAAVGCGGGGT